MLGARDGASPAPPAPAAVDPAAVSELIFTSGTEATPKGVLHTEHTTNCNVRSAYAVNELGAADVVWAPSPIGHSTGLNFGVRLALYFGMKLVLQDRWDPDRAAELVERERCSYTLAATTFLTDLIEAARRSGRDLSSLTRFGCGGAPSRPRSCGRAPTPASTCCASTGSRRRWWCRGTGPRRRWSTGCTPTAGRCPRWSSTCATAR